MSGYGIIRNTPELHFDSGYEKKVKADKDGAQEWGELFKELNDNADSIRFFETFKHDLACCIYKQCSVCHLRGQKGCKHTLKENAEKMIENQMRMCMAFYEQRNEEAEDANK